MTEANSTLTTAAFIALGFGSESKMAEPLGVGHDTLIAEAVKYASLLDELATAAYAESKPFPGVMDYEVSEGFGMWYHAYLRTTGKFPTDKVATAALRDMFDKFMTQANHGRP